MDRCFNLFTKGQCILWKRKAAAVANQRELFGGAISAVSKTRVSP